MPIEEFANVVCSTKPIVRKEPMPENKYTPIEELSEHVTALKKLFNDPHPGLAMWCRAVNRRWKAIHDLWEREEPPK